MLVVGLGVAVVEGIEVLGLVAAMPAVEGASFFPQPQAIQLGELQLDDPQPPVLQPLLVSATPTTRPAVKVRTKEGRNKVQCMIRNPFPDPPLFRAALSGETGD
jgi:hypothetical protein